MAMIRVANEMAEPTNVPSQKTLAATGGSVVGSAISTIALFFITRHIDLPQPVQGAITVLISAFFTFLLGYVVPPNAKEAVVRDASGKVMLARVP